MQQEEQVAKVTIFDPENKFVAFTAAYGDGGSSEGAGVRQVVEAWGAVWVLTESGQVGHFHPRQPDDSGLTSRREQLHRLTEQPLQNSLVTLYQRSLYTLAISLAKSRGLGQSEVGEIYRK